MKHGPGVACGARPHRKTLQDPIQLGPIQFGWEGVVLPNPAAHLPLVRRELYSRTRQRTCPWLEGSCTPEPSSAPALGWKGVVLPNPAVHLPLPLVGRELYSRPRQRTCLWLEGSCTPDPGSAPAFGWKGVVLPNPAAHLPLVRRELYSRTRQRNCLRTACPSPIQFNRKQTRP